MKNTVRLQNSLQIKIGAIFLLLGLAFTAGSYAILQWLVLPAFETFEREQADENLVRVIRVLAAELQTLTIINNEYSEWDDTYDFVRGRYDSYIEDNVDVESWSALGVEMMLFFDREGAPIWGNIYHPNGMEKLLFDEQFGSTLLPGNPLVTHKNSDSKTAGLIQLPAGLMLVVSYPVLKTGGIGAVAGSYVAGYFLTRERVAQIGRRASVDVSLLPVSNQRLSKPAQDALEALTNSTDSIQLTTTDEQLLSYTLLSDIYGNDAALLQAKTPRTVSAMGASIIELAMLFLFVASAIFILSSWVLLRWLIVDPIGELKNHMASIRETGNLSRRISARRADEIGALATEFDVMTSELHQTQKALHAARDEALAMSQSKSEFLATMSHEIRTPMNGVIGMTELLLKTNLSKKQSRLASTVKNSARSLLSIINDILDFSKINAGKMLIENRPFSIDFLVKDLNSLIAESAQVKGVEYLCRVDNALPGSVICDDQRVRQVLVNLLGNAIKFTEVGEIVLSIDCVKSWEEGHGQWASVRFSVADTGIGIKDSAKKRIFDSFSQADGSTTRLYGGTGLGLAISKQLVELMGGSIGVESTPGKGATFHFTLPMQISSDVMVEDLYDSERLRGLKALVVDDNATNLEIVESHLVHWGTAVDCASGSTEAFASLERAAESGWHYDLLLTDYHMPEMDGLMLSGKVWGEDRYGKPAIVILSSVADDFGVEELAARGIRGYLTKPVLRDNLFTYICRALDQPLDVKSIPRAAELLQLAEDRLQFNAKVLVAEDNPVNQELILIILESYGCRVTVAGNGQQAINHLEQGTFDLVVMDCQMPVMDGFEATTAIRDRGLKASSGGPLPILALTANAMEGDRERCLAAGMDTYLSKPFEEADLVDMLKALLPDARPGTMLESQALDKVRALQREGNPSVLARLIDIYLEKSPQLVSELEHGVLANDAKTVEINAHSLKSSSANLGAAQFADLCRQIEEMGRNSNLDKIETLLNRLASEFSHVCDALKREREYG